MSSIDSQEDKTSSLAFIQQHDRKKKLVTVTVTMCPPGCGNGICQRVFIDSLDLGFQVICECKKCHGSPTDEEDLA